MLKLVIFLAYLSAASSTPMGQGICDYKAAAQQNLPRNARPATRNNLPTVRNKIIADLQLKSHLQPELIRSEGYPAETYYATTDDGYILALHRIPHGKTNGNEDIKRPVIFVQHGILASSADWVLSTPSKGLGTFKTHHSKFEIIIRH